MHPVTIAGGREIEEEEQMRPKRRVRTTFGLILLATFAVLAVSACGGGGAREETKARTIPEEGPLSAGRYSTQEFEPPFSFEPGEGWHVWYPEEPYSVELAQGGGNDNQLAFYKAQEIFEPRKDDGEVYFEARPAPRNLIAWFLRHPYVDASEAKPVLQLGGDLVIHALGRGSADGFIVLDDVEGKTVIVWFSAPPDELDGFLPEVDKVLDTMEWKGA
jgi:hypothetical protein